MAQLTTSPEPGVYENIPEAEYRAWDAFNYSGLKHLLRSPFHYWHSLHAEDSPSPYQKLGRLVDERLSDPLEYASHYVVMPDLTAGIRKADGSEYSNVKATKTYKDLVARFKSDHAHCEVIEQDTADIVEAMADSLKGSADGAKILKHQGKAQLSLVWDQAGVRCKARLDKYIKDAGILVDWKTSFSAAPQSFENTIKKYKYYVQAAFYMQGLRALLQPAQSFVWAVIESEPPYAAACYQPDWVTIEAGERVIAHALEVYRKCKAANEWPGYPTGFKQLSLPDYELERIEVMYS